MSGTAAVGFDRDCRVRTFFVSFLVAMVVAAVATPIVRRLAARVGAVDHPGRRRVHARAVSRLGGIAILTGFLAPLVALFFFNNYIATVFHSDALKALGLLVGAVAMAGLGVVDDVKGVRAIHKLFFQIAIAMGAYLVGFRIDAINLPLLGPLDMGVFALPVTVLWIVGIVNAVNLIDGLDGLAAGVAFMACLVNFVVSMFSEVYMVSLLAAALGGALVGFLIYNFNPATIFMGDSGSLFIGFVLATLSLEGSAAKATTAVSLLVPILAMGLPIMDTLLAIVRRYLERRPIFSADQGHIHHRLLELGLTQRRAVLVLYGTSLVFTVAAILVYVGRAWQISFALAISSLAVVALVRGVGLFQFQNIRRLQREGKRSEDTNRLRLALPGFLTNMQATSDVPEAISVLEEFCRSNQIESVECVGAGIPDVGDWTWTRNGSVPARGARGQNRELPVSVSFDLGLGDVSGTLTFHWFSESGDISPQADIMIQLAVDAFERQLAFFAGQPWPRVRATTSSTTSEARQSAHPPAPGKKTSLSYS